VALPSRNNADYSRTSRIRQEISTPLSESLSHFKNLRIGACIALMKLEYEMQRGETIMDRMLVVVFDTETKAYEGKRALQELENDGSIVIYASAVVAKNADGSTSVRQTDDPGPFGTLVGTSLGAVIGLLGGPAGFAIGAAVGLLAGSTTDINNARISDDFIDDVNKKLLPNNFAVVAEIQEDWTAAVDTRMESIGGTIFRRALSDVRHIVDQEEIAAMKADMAQMKAGHAKSRADRKAKLQEKINQLDTKIQAQLEKVKERRIAAEQREKAKAEFLKIKAADMKAKAAETRI
jgi:uncharacterized membrane protein